MKRINQRKRHKQAKMTVFAYSCACGSPTDCLNECGTYNFAYLENATSAASNAAKPYQA